MVLYKSASIKPIDVIETGTKGITNGIPQMEMVYENKDGVETSSVTRFIGSSESVDRDGEIVSLDGWDFMNFINNPVVLWMHERRALPIGKIVGIYKDKVRRLLYFDVMFSESHELARSVKSLVDEGIVRATSVGFKINDWKWVEDTLVFTKVELLELSIVTIPANQDAVIENDNGDNMEIKSADTDALREAITVMQETLNGVNTAIGDLKERVETIANPIPTEPVPPVVEPPVDVTPPANPEPAIPEVAPMTEQTIRDLIAEVVTAIINPPNLGETEANPEQSGSEGEDNSTGSNNPEPKPEEDEVVMVSIGDLDELTEFSIINEEE